METYLGLDFGGTKLLIGEMDKNGKILREKRYKTGCRKEMDAIDVITASLKDYVAEVGFAGEVQGAGLGIVGTVDYKNGKWITMHPRITIQPIPVTDILTDILHVPAWVDNDVKCATNAEMTFGLGKNFDNFVYLNVGTGLSAGFVIDGKILRGRKNNAGEVGHTVVDLNNYDPCICGRRGCIEGVVSGYGFTQQVMNYELHDIYPQSGDIVDVTLLFQKALEGETAPEEILNYASESLSNLIMNLVKILDPEAFILGGGCVKNGILIERIKQKLTPSIKETITGGIHLSNLDSSYTGLLGAAALALSAGK